MKFSKLLISIILILILMLNFIPIASFADDESDSEIPEDSVDHYFSVPANTWRSDNKKVQITTGLDAANLTLPNGLELVHISSDIEDSTKVETVTEPIEIICIVDISGSMQGANISALRTALSQFGKYAFDGFNDLKLDIITFSSRGSGQDQTGNGKIILSGCSDSDEFQNVTNALNSDGGGTMIYSAFERALERIDEIKNSEDDKNRKIYLVNLTDGIDHSFKSYYGDNDPKCTPSYTRKKLHESVEAVDGTFNILFGVSSSEVFIPDSTYPDLGKTYQNVSTTEIEEIYNAILEEIMNNFFTGNINLEMKSGSRYCSATTDNIFMTLDTELSQSSVVKLEYFVMIRSFEELEKIQIVCNTDDHAIFNSNEKLLTENRKNSNYRWFVSDTNLNKVATFIPASLLSLREADTGLDQITFKLVVSYLLSPNSDLDFNNTFRIRVFTKDKSGNSNTYDGFDGEETESLKVTVVPPFGANKNYTLTINTYIMILLGILLIIYKTKKRYIKI